ncbi:hypothetical protein FA95DRAFT_1371500 [Auriscalpium vulgare]|uniref:Uncharacterized protein n=1 Tax=Auriscalpium vulgare TaxID=40419 RepID=A0ACB8RQT8_9AGAM|nr:hypothetical protein FA95DRAFT_1371500 [Auriscalpium vulgare]
MGMEMGHPGSKMPMPHGNAGMHPHGEDKLTLSLILWFTFHIIGGHILLPILVITFIFSRAKRGVPLINLAATFSLGSVCACLLLYADEYDGPRPDSSLCLFQAATMCASGPMYATATLTLVLHMRTSMDKLFGVKLRKEGLPWILTMLLAPYVVFIALVVTVSVVGAQMPELVTRHRRKRYCDLNYWPTSVTADAITGLMAIAVIGYTIDVCVRLYRYCWYKRRTGEPATIVKLIIRLLLFIVYLLCGLLLSLFSIIDNAHETGRDMFLATFGIAFFLFFGIHQDVLHAWAFWRPRDPEADNHPPPALCRESTLPEDSDPRRVIDIEAAAIPPQKSEEGVQSAALPPQTQV